MLIQILFFLLVGFSQGAEVSYTPKGSCDQEIHHQYYSICYSDEHRQAKWTYHKLTLKSINGKQKRTNDFREDPNLDDPVGKKDFSGSGYDRGHMVPAGDMKLSKTSMSQTFYMSNMSPQNSSLNRGLWGSLEMKVRSWVKDNGDAFVVTAPILEKNLDTIESGVSIPDYYYKIIYFPQIDVMKAFLVPNKKPIDKNFYNYSVSVDEIEKITGLDFFAELPNSLENKLESINYYQ